VSIGQIGSIRIILTEWQILGALLSICVEKIEKGFFGADLLLAN
jgi:hypothetical protein